MKKVIGFIAVTAAVVAGAIGVQAFATDGRHDNERSPAITQTTQVPSAGQSSGGQQDDGQRDGFTDDHTGKPGESK